jgi:hypothetical protein
MHRFVVTLFVFLAVPTAATAQQAPNTTEAPLGVVAVPRSQLEGALSARQNCQTLILLLNDLGAHWQQVSSGDLSRRDFEDLHKEAQIEWDIRWGACAGARRDLADGMPHKVLDEEVAQLRELWLSLHRAADALEADVGAARINQKVQSYAVALEAWSLALPARAKFWDGSADAPGDNPENSCVWQTERAQQSLSVELMKAAAGDRSLSTDESIDQLRLQLEKTDRLRRECRHADAKEEAELQILARMMTSHRRLFEGFVEGDDSIIRESMVTAQESASRLKRCRNEHKSGAPVSSSCLPQ